MTVTITEAHDLGIGYIGMTLGDWIEQIETRHGPCMIQLDGMAWRIVAAAEIIRSSWADWRIDRAEGMTAEAETHVFEIIPESDYIASQMGISANMAGEGE